MLSITGLKAGTGGKEILKGLSLNVNKGEIHAVMGPNGSGKSTLARVIAGHPDYIVTEGTIQYKPGDRDLDLTTLETDVRAKEGIFVGFQYPVEIPGVTNSLFLREAYNSIAKYKGKELLDPYDFDELLRSKLRDLEMDESLVNRPVNEGFSGGEKKKNEILQMTVFNPSLIILDETDSGLDIDALKIVAKGIKSVASGGDNAIILITHYQRLLNYVEPDFVHVFTDGRIVKSGGMDLADMLEETGYENFM